MRYFVRACTLSALALLLTGCEKYKAKPLDGPATLAKVDRWRHLQGDETGGVSTVQISSSQPCTFSRAAELMLAHSPALQEVRAEYQTALAVAKVKTPFPNPALEAGPNYGFGPGVDSLYRLQPFASLGFTIPTGRRLKRQDELNASNAALAWAEFQIKQRVLYLDLRASYTRLALADRRAEVRRRIAESAQQSSAVTRKLIDAGTATALDAGLIELEQARLKSSELDAKADRVNTLGELSELAGVHADFFNVMPENPLPALDSPLPKLEELKDLLVNNHPELARLRAKYEVAERQLRLEIAKQYPDIHIGPSYEGDPGEQKRVLGLTIGLELPIFDRNQQALAQAKLSRDEVRVKYEAAANRALAGLERAHRNYELAREKLKLLNDIILPKAANNIEQARKALGAGVSDALKFLETERSQRDAQNDALETELSARAAWVELEKTVGHPLLSFPSESAPPSLNTPEPTLPGEPYNKEGAQ